MHDAAFGHEHRDLYEKATDIEGIEQLTLTSVGIDIGSSTSHLLFSRLTLRREGAGHSAQFKVTDREVLWSSPILLTPYLSKTLMDFENIKNFIKDCYHSADLHSHDIDTGAVVITGEALKKENAQPISEYFMHSSGKFICASAGPHHEALLAAFGSGSVQMSKVSQSRILNVDMGGGTTKFSLIANGKIISTAAINIGARLIAYDHDNRITRIEDAGSIVSQAVVQKLVVGDIVDEDEKQKIGTLMGQTLIDVLKHGSTMGPLARRLMITPALENFSGLGDFDYIIFSGGVAEYIYNHTSEAYGDLGPFLGATLRGYLGTLPRGTLMEPTQGIRATVIGASEYTVQVSGATSFFTSTSNLPAYGLKAVYVGHVVGSSFFESLKKAFIKYDIPEFGTGMALSISIDGDLNYATLKEIALGLVEAVKNSPHIPVILTIEQDVARSLGSILKNELQLTNDLISIDGISVGMLDYIDIGKPVSMMELFPVTVKSLLFSSEPLL
ncbi:MAG TPA: ethanolamine ammonia-lyase reactivating factor EutA [Acidocella sp.]|nr:MAG: recombinase [Acidocella sp. 20-58-15]HQT38519.1 ethanolamine ammonia-lyase reactivating factor EutA [Acidocella sp.]